MSDADIYYNGEPIDATDDPPFDVDDIWYTIDSEAVYIFDDKPDVDRRDQIEGGD